MSTSTCSPFLRLCAVGRTLRLSHRAGTVSATLFNRSGRVVLASAIAEVHGLRLTAEDLPCLWLGRAAFDLSAKELAQVREWLAAQGISHG